jgi:hypothetical protein
MMPRAGKPRCSVPDWVHFAIALGFLAIVVLLDCTKPFGLSALLAKVREALHSRKSPVPSVLP